MYIPYIHYNIVIAAVSHTSPVAGISFHVESCVFSKELGALFTWGEKLPVAGTCMKMANHNDGQHKVPTRLIYMYVCEGSCFYIL